MLLFPEFSDRDVDFIFPSLVLHLRIKRGDFLYSFVTYKSLEKPRLDWTLGVDDVVKDPIFDNVLRKNNLLDAISLSASLEIKGSNAHLNAFIAQWSRQTHTSFLQTGECGPTLEDVALLLRLGSRGTVYFDPTSSTEEDDVAVNQIRLCFTDAAKESTWFNNNGQKMSAWASSDKCTWGNWIRHFFKDIPANKGNPTDKKEEPIIGPKYRKNIYLAGFIAYFLSFFVLLGYPTAAPRSSLFMLAV
ncbi:hypothetical protein RHMOL_Rhmol02G0248400 [Rhododendron molle]|uniref:Uncharacterized protein n=1 Tax=Rhododendron molle TaxID=49168 RepID=A0ACC0PUA3_RHOML|nr:hypothetical protein RHMOL_Rhmol02G0248400 [Rhododendron molle]